MTSETVAHQAPLSSKTCQSSFRFMSMESVMPSSHLILCCPLLLLPSIFPSIRVFSSELFLHIRWPTYCSFSFSFSSSSEYSGLIFFRIDCFDFLIVQGTLKSLQTSRSIDTLNIVKALLKSSVMHGQTPVIVPSLSPGNRM